MASAKSGFAVGVLVGLGGVFVLAVLGGAIAFSRVRMAASEARRGWDLVPVIVMAQDGPAGSALTQEMLAQRPMPSQFVSESNVKLDEKVLGTLSGARLAVPLKAGDPLRWSDFVTAQDPKLCDWIEEAKKAGKLPAAKDARP